uniref:Immunoglobulin domain-containing protein n=1 Tax=Capra hircus TaxID=9925 RepID=A0A452FPY6_CAPHI
MCPTLLSLLSLEGTNSIFLSKPVTPSLLGEYEKPSLSAWPSPMVSLGQIVTLQCHFHSPLKSFRLFKTDGASLPELHGHHFNNFTLGPVTREHAGCYGSLRHTPYEWSSPSDPVDIIITGECGQTSAFCSLCHRRSNVQSSITVTSKFHLFQENHTYQGLLLPARFRKPSLSAQGGPVVRSGENVTLVCSSESAFDQFHLLREEEDLGPLLAGGRGPHGALQAEFLLGPGTQAHSRVYRCYGSFTRSPYLWSDSSDPLFLSVTGEEPLPETQLPQEHSSTWYVVLGLSTAFTSTSIFLAALVCHWCSTPNHVAIMEGEPMEDRTVNGEVIHHSHLSPLRTLQQKTDGPLLAPLRPIHPSAEPIICEEFNINQDRAVP